MLTGFKHTLVLNERYRTVSSCLPGLSAYRRVRTQKAINGQPGKPNDLNKAFHINMYSIPAYLLQTSRTTNGNVKFLIPSTSHDLEDLMNCAVHYSEHNRKNTEKCDCTTERNHIQLTLRTCEYIVHWCYQHVLHH